MRGGEGHIRLRGAGLAARGTIPRKGHSGERTSQGSRQRGLPFLHCSHTGANTLNHARKEVTFAGEEEHSEGSKLPIRLRYIVTGGLLCDVIMCMCVDVRPVAQP